MTLWLIANDSTILYPVIFQCQPLGAQCCYVSLCYPVASGSFLYSGCPVDWQHWPTGIWVSSSSVFTFQLLNVFTDSKIYLPGHLMKKCGDYINKVSVLLHIPFNSIQYSDQQLPKSDSFDDAIRKFCFNCEEYENIYYTKNGLLLYHNHDQFIICFVYTDIRIP